MEWKYYFKFNNHYVYIHNVYIISRVRVLIVTSLLCLKRSVSEGFFHEASHLFPAILPQEAPGAALLLPESRTRVPLNTPKHTLLCGTLNTMSSPSCVTITPYWKPTWTCWFISQQNPLRYKNIVDNKLS